MSLEQLPHQLDVQACVILVFAPGRAPLCLRCKPTGHIRKDCRVPRCATCHRFGHIALDCVGTYATSVTSQEKEPDEAPMDAQEAEAGARNGGVTEMAPTTAVAAPQRLLHLNPWLWVMTPAEFSPGEESSSDASPVLAQTMPDPAREEGPSGHVSVEISQKKLLPAGRAHKGRPHVSDLGDDDSMDPTHALPTKRPLEVDQDGSSVDAEGATDPTWQTVPGRRRRARASSQVLSRD